MSKTAEEATGPAEYSNVLQYIHVSESSTIPNVLFQNVLSWTGEHLEQHLEQLRYCDGYLDKKRALKYVLLRLRV